MQARSHGRTLKRSIICARLNLRSSQMTAPTPQQIFSLARATRLWVTSTTSTLTTGAWGYQPNATIKSRDDVIRLLVGAVGRDGNLLLNVGPRPDGQIEPAQAERLREVGDWLEQYGQSIYATRGGPYLPGDFGVSTYRDKTVYLHILDPIAKTLLLPALPVRILDCSALTGGKATCVQTAAGVQVTLNGNPSTVDTIVAVSLVSPAVEIKPIETGL
jgi:alpha-L-fucosidase